MTIQMLYTDEGLGENAKKLHIINDSSYNWETWNEVVDEGHLDHIPAIKEIRTKNQKGPLGFGEDWKGEIVSCGSNIDARSDY
jgi:endonuclease IV